MHRLSYRIITVALTILVVVSMASTGAALAKSDNDSAIAEAGENSVQSSVQSDTDDDLNIIHSYALKPNQPGTVGVTLTYKFTDRVSRFQTTLPESSNVTNTVGFDRSNQTTYEWDGTTKTATIELDYNPNASEESKFGTRQYSFVDTGEWALIRPISTDPQWRYTGKEPIEYNTSLTTDGPGVAGTNMIYLGNVTIFERTANKETFRLAVPEQAELAEPTDEILNSLVNASESLRVGNRHDELLAIAAPTEGVRWGPGGLASGSDFWVSDDTRVNRARNPWLHEYIHTRQGFSTTAETQWITEGSADYYATLLTLEQGRITFEEFNNQLAEGENYSAVTLSDPSSWYSEAHYIKGALVIGRIDATIRSDSDQDFQAVMKELNDNSSQVTQSQFLAAVEDTGGPESRSRAETYTQTNSSVSMWNVTTHSRRFGTPPVRTKTEVHTKTGVRSKMERVANLLPVKNPSNPMFILLTCTAVVFVVGLLRRW